MNPLKMKELIACNSSGGGDYKGYQGYKRSKKNHKVTGNFPKIDYPLKCDWQFKAIQNLVRLLEKQAQTILSIS